MKIKLYSLLGALLGALVSIIAFILILLLGLAKGDGVTKVLVAPFYNDFDFKNTPIISYPLFIFSILGFYWLLQKEWLLKRIKLVGFALGVGVTIIFLIKIPFFEFQRNLASTLYSNIGIKTKTITENEAQKTITSGYGADLNSFPKIVIDMEESGSVEPVYNEYIAFTCEISFTSAGDRCAKKYWEKSFESIDETDLLKKSEIMKNKYFNQFKIFFKKYPEYIFKSKQEMELIKYMMMEAMLYRLDINVGDYFSKTKTDHIAIYETLKRQGFYFANFFLEKKIPNEEIKVKLYDFFKI